MKLFPLATPQSSNGPADQDRLTAPPPAPEAQSDAARSAFSRTEDLPAGSPHARAVTAEFRLEFGPTEPTGPDAKKMLAQIERGLANSRVNSKA